MSESITFHRQVAARFGVAPHFFISASYAPESVEKPWDFATYAGKDTSPVSVGTTQ